MLNVSPVALRELLFLLINYLRSYVVWCSTEGLGGDSVIHIFFTHAKVCYLNVTLTVQHHIVQLQVSTGGRKIKEGIIVCQQQPSMNCSCRRKKYRLICPVFIFSLQLKHTLLLVTQYSLWTFLLNAAACDWSVK